MSPEIQSLIDSKLDGTIDDTGSRKLSNWIVEEKANAIEYARQTLAHAQIRETLSYEQTPNFVESIIPVSLVRSESDGRPRYLALAKVGIVTLALAVCLLVILWPNEKHKHNVLANVVREVDALLSRDGERWEEPKLTAGKYNLKYGLLNLQFGGRVQVYIEAPARFDAISDKRLVLHSGRLSASVPPEGIGFTVETSEAEVVDFGTEFSVEAELGRSEVHVFDGLVRVQSRIQKAGEETPLVDVRTSQAVKFEGESSQPVDIELDTNRFIRNFEEPELKYITVVNQLAPVAHYRMPIRKGLLCNPPQYSGELLTGAGKKPPRGPGFRGASLRVKAESSGRGARVPFPPPLDKGQFTLCVAIYARSRMSGAVVATNIDGDKGFFSLSLDKDGRLMAVMRTKEGKLVKCLGRTVIPLETWAHVVFTVDRKQMRLFENGTLAGIKECQEMALGNRDTIWFGTDPTASALWDGRIDELSLFDRALSTKAITELYQSARNQVSGSDKQPLEE